MQRHLRVIAMAALTAAFSISAGPAWAQESAGAYPRKSVAVVVANTAGGTSDVEARVYAQKLSEALNQTFVVINKPGAGSTIGADYVAKAIPDGYTLLIGTSSFTVTPAFRTNLPYDAIKSFAPVSLMTKRPTVLVVSPGFPAKSLTEYIAYAKANPGKINWGTSGVGGIAHLSGVWLHSAVKTTATYVHYKGSSQMYPDLLSGRIQAHPASLQTAMPNIRSGKTRAIALLSLDRSALLPDLRTAAEEGIPGFEQPSWLGILTTGGTPAPIVAKLSAELAKIAKLPDVVQKFAPEGTIMTGGTPAQFREFITTEISRWRKLIQEHNIQEAE